MHDRIISFHTGNLSSEKKGGKFGGRNFHEIDCLQHASGLERCRCNFPDTPFAKKVHRMPDKTGLVLGGKIELEFLTAIQI